MSHRRDAARAQRAWARWARQLGFDRNPLRRTTDRIEAIVRLVIVILLLAGMPAAAVMAGQRADHLALRQVQAQQAGDRLVTAVLLQNAPVTGSPDPYTSVQMAWVRASWHPAGAPARTGDVLADAGARRGSTLPIWITRSGRLTGPPLDHRMIVGDVCFAVVLTCLASLLVLLGSAALARRILDRRRLRGWEAEWRAISAARSS